MRTLFSFIVFYVMCHTCYANVAFNLTDGGTHWMRTNSGSIFIVKNTPSPRKSFILPNKRPYPVRKASEESDEPNISETNESPKIDSKVNNIVEETVEWVESAERTTKVYNLIEEIIKPVILELDESPGNTTKVYNIVERTVEPVIVESNESPEKTTNVYDTSQLNDEQVSSNITPTFNLTDGDTHWFWADRADDGEFLKRSLENSIEEYYSADIYYKTRRLKSLRCWSNEHMTTDDEFGCQMCSCNGQGSMLCTIHECGLEFRDGRVEDIMQKHQAMFNQSLFKKLDLRVHAIHCPPDWSIDLSAPTCSCRCVATGVFKCLNTCFETPSTMRDPRMKEYIAQLKEKLHSQEDSMEDPVVRELLYLDEHVIDSGGS